MGRPVDNCRIDDATAAAGARGKHAGKHAHRQIKCTAADISDQRGRVQMAARRDWPNTRPHPRHRDVIEIMAGRLGPWSSLAPTGHPPIDQIRVELI
jgi:hypothetical protein